MKFKAKSRSEIVEELRLGGLCEGWIIKIRYISPAHEQALRDEVTAKRVNYTDLYSDNAIVGWEGCTPLMIGALVELDTDSDPVPTDSDGNVPYSQELARFLMREAPADAFQNHIYQMASTLLRRIALGKKNAHSASDA